MEIEDPFALEAQKEVVASIGVAVERNIDRHRRCLAVLVRSDWNRRELADCLREGHAEIPFVDMGRNLPSCLPAFP